MKNIRLVSLLISFFVILSSSGLASQAESRPDTGGAIVSSDVSVVQIVHKSRESVAANDLRAALEYARRAVAVDPAYDEAWKQLGRVLMLKGDYDEAMASFQRALELKPADAEVQVWILHSLLAQGKIREFMAHLESMQESTISLLDNKIITGLLSQLFDQSDLQSAQKIAVFWEKKAPLHASRQTAKAVGLLIVGDLETAETLLAKADTSVRDNLPLLALTWDRLGVQYFEINEPAKAIDAFRRALEIRPGWIPALRELGWAYRRSGKPVLAADTWELGLKKEPRLTGWFRWIVEALLEAGQLERASVALDRLLKYEPNNDRGQSLKLMILLVRKDEKGAELYEKKLLIRKGGHDIILLGHILADRQAGRFEEAAVQLEQLHLSRPGDIETHDLLAETYAAWASHASPKDALKPLQKLVSLKPNNAGALRDLGWSLWINGKYDEAINAWENALNNSLPDQDRLIKQVTARLIEDGYTEKAEDFYKRRYPNASLLQLGLMLINEKRYVAARAILLKAWDAKENLPVTGLYLGYAEAYLYICIPLPDHFNPVIEHGAAAIDKEKANIIAEAALKCSTDVSILQLVNKIEPVLDAFPERASTMTDILENASDAQYVQRDLEKSFDLYRRVLKRDPNRANAWFRYSDIAKGIGHNDEANSYLKDVLSRSSSTSVREGILGKLAAGSDDLSAATDHYRKSIAEDPNQPDLRLDLFRLLIRLGRYDEARSETGWFSNRLSSGDLTVRSYLAEMLTSMQEPEAALKIWQELHLAFPETPYYAIETVMALFSLCREQEAVRILEELVTLKPDPRAYELLAEIENTLGNADRAFNWTEAARSVQPTPGLFKNRSDAAESLGKFAVAQKAAEAVIKSDTGNVSAARIAGKSMIEQGLFDDAKVFFEGLLKRNQEFLPSLVHLREIAYEQKRSMDALNYSKQAVDGRNWDALAQIRYAVSLAEGENFRPSLEYLRAQANKDINLTTPILMYNNVTRCSFKGRNTSDQIISHLERLKADGYRFITSVELDNAEDRPSVIIVIVDPDPSVLPMLDSAMQRLETRAVLATHSGSLLNQIPGDPSPELLKKLQESGRWVIASSGPATFRREVVNKAGTLGNPLTHKLYNRETENDVSMSDRINKVFDEASRSLSASQPRIFVYPEGDYGQLSLDTDPKTIDSLHDSVRKYFAFAIAADDGGYVISGFDAMRLPGRIVPPLWDADELMNQLRRNNPLIRARLELAKVLYWEGQYEKAHQWFGKATALGADPSEINFHWGNSAYQEGNLPGALERLRLAGELDPASKRNAAALERAEIRKRLLLDLQYNGWRDSDQRSYLQYGGNINGYVSDRLRLELFANRNRWAREGLGNEEGIRIGAGALWHFSDQHWVTGRLWYMSLDHISDHVGGLVNVHLPVAPISGNIELEAAREEIDTVEAVRKKILADRFELNAISRIKDKWDLNPDLSYIHRSDGNDTYMLDASFGRRLHEWPFLSVGYDLHLGDSDRYPPEYWAPKGLQEHLLYLLTRGEYKKLHYYGSFKAGYAEEQNTPWRFVWSARVILDYVIMSHLTVGGEFQYLKLPTYNSTAWFLRLKYRF